MVALSLGFSGIIYKDIERHHSMMCADPHSSLFCIGGMMMNKVSR